MKKSTMLKVSAAPLALGLALAGSPAFAQTTEEDVGVGPVESVDTPTAEQGDVIIVTGTRILQPNLESASPVTVVGAAEITQTGTTRVEDLINSLPQVFAGQGSTVSNGSTGTATVNLRGLGSERNLVLVNGRRLVPGDPSSAAADLNVIPAAIIKRVDVLTGGASAVYGADAVSGVVNFVMDTEFEGFKLDAQYSLYNHDNRGDAAYVDALNARRFAYPTGMVADGGAIDATLAFGTSFDDGRGHATAYVGYRKINAVLQRDRDYSACSLSPRSVANATLRPYDCGGSGTSPTGTVYAFDSGGDPADFTSVTLQFGPNRTLLPGRTLYNFAPLNYYQRPDERYTAGVFADYEISEALHPYMEFMFMDDRTVAQIAPSGNFGNTLSINCDNPLLSAQQRAILCDAENLLVSPNPDNAFDVVGNTGDPAFNFIDAATGRTYNRGFAQILRRNVEGGGRQDDLQHTSYRAVIGTRGQLSPVWTYDAYYQYGRTNFAQTYRNDFSVTRLARAIDIVRDASGNIVCRSATDGTDPNCVPWDIFSPGTVTPSAASVNYLATPGFSRGIVTQQVASAYVSGLLGDYGIKSPWSADGVGLVLGAEYRKENLEFNADTAFQTGDLAGQGAPTLPVAGSYDVKELYTEVSLPLVRDSFIDDFTITAGYRYSDYSLGFSTDTWKIQGELSPTRDLRIRGGFNRAVRAPTVQDLFAPQRVALDGSTDPCSGAPIAATDVGCLATGLRVGQVVAPNPADQYNGLIGGNPQLGPETADTWTVGAVLTPRFLPGFSASIDYFDIVVEGAIQGIGADTILEQCSRTVADPFFCGLVQRDGSGSLWRSSNGYVTDLSQNIGKLATSGIDVQAGYNREIGDLGRLSLSFVGTWLEELVSNPGVPGVADTDCVGRYGPICGTPNPEWRHQMRVGFDFADGFGASVRWRHFGSVDVDGLSPTTAPAVRTFDAQNYFDLALTWEVGDHYNFRLGANNILDKEPPLTGGSACPAGSCNGNTFSQVYDALGRYIYAGVTLDF
ncbi:MAG: TonB-dependent receptor [Citromicrobium sp.]|nr:MAG: TonB-dependent receptor [Citromicrobium sp.]